MGLSKRLMSLMLFGIAVLATATPAAAQDANSGAVVFKRCAICHSSEPNKGPKIGPALNNIVGRKAGKAAGFAFSPALAKSGIVWTTDKLDAFIERPSKVVPGNRMAFGGIADAKQRADLVAFLKTLRK